MNIYEIEELSKNTSPYFFDRKTMKFFGQTMASFKVYKQDDGRFLILAPMRDHDGKNMGTTKRYFNPKTNELELSE